jgi:UDP-GlcNAc3NAcA epimerase
MSDVFLMNSVSLKPDYNLGIGSGPCGKQTGEILAKIKEVLLKENPDLVIVYGDTNSTLAGALAAVRLHIPVAHGEAGLRSFNPTMPEEINRIVTDHISDFLFCPTENAVRFLAKEGITRGVHLVGDVMADVLEYNKLLAGKKSCVMETPGLVSKGYGVATIHRPSNTDNPDALSAIIRVFSCVM